MVEYTLVGTVVVTVNRESTKQPFVRVCLWFVGSLLRLVPSFSSSLSNDHHGGDDHRPLGTTVVSAVLRVIKKCNVTFV